MPAQQEPNTEGQSMKKLAACAALALCLSLSACDPEYEEFMREQKALDISRGVQKFKSECLKNGGTFKTNLDMNNNSLFASNSLRTECVYAPEKGE